MANGIHPAIALKVRAIVLAPAMSSDINISGLSMSGPNSTPISPSAEMVSSSSPESSSETSNISDQAATSTPVVESATVEAAVASSAVADEPAATATPAMNEPSAVAEEPAVTEAAAVQDEPAAPAEAELPSLTEQPSAPERPSASEQPSAIEPPTATSQPVTTPQPAAVAQPEAPKQAVAVPETPKPPSDPVIAERITIPANPSSDDSAPEGGEWDLLTAKVKAWWESNDIGEQVSQLRQPLRIAAYLIGALLVLRVYAGLLAAIDNIPLASGLLELVGVCWVLRFSATRLVRSQDRAEVLQGLRQRWTSFAGKK